MNLSSMSPSLCKAVSITSFQNGVISLYISDFVDCKYRTKAIKSAVEKNGRMTLELFHFHTKP